MYKTILFFLLCFVHFSNAVNPPSISECYDYHTPHYYEVFTENNRVIFQHTVKDPNGISYVSRDRIVLDSLNGKDFKMLAEDAEKILFTTIDGYFFIEKNVYDVKNYGISKISGSRSITETIGTDLVCKNNKWFYVLPKSYSKDISEKEVKSVPDNLKYFQSDILREGTLYKNAEAVYIFNNEELTFRQIPNLTGKNTHFVKNFKENKEGFIYDDDTFYYTSFNELIDYTNQFTSQKEFTNFKNAEIVIHQFEVSINTNDGVIWLYLRFEIDNDKGDRTKIFPVKGTYLGKNKELIQYKDGVYNDFYNLLNNKSSINMSAIEDLENLDSDPLFYKDGKMRYLFDYDKNGYKPVKWLPVDATFHPSNGTYGYLSTNSFYADNTSIYFVDRLEKQSKTLKHTSALKDLKLAYAYDDKILIENKEIKNIGERESIEFLGSTVDVISPCDGGNGQHPVEIDVYYFFKDSSGVYVCNTSNLKMRQLKNEDSFKAKIDNYDYLKQLMEAS